jgi:hypothetical protein
MRRAVLMVVLMIVPALSGCLEDFEGGLQDVGDGVDKLLAPRASVAVSKLTEGGWNRDGHFGVEITHNRALSGTVEMTNRANGAVTVQRVAATEAVPTTGGLHFTRLEVLIDDGEWDLRVLVDGHTWQRLYDVRIDSVAPVISGLELNANAPDGTYLLGNGASFSDGKLRVLSPNGTPLGTSFPVQLNGLGDGIHIFQVILEDQAGNRATELVQVISGKATDLPAGDATFGVVSRYTIQAELWDLASAEKYLMPAEARDEAPGYMGTGYGVTPREAVVVGVIADIVDDDMTTMEVALAVYEWMFDELEYDDERLVSQTLMLPRHVIEDSEDADAETNGGSDSGKDGLSDDGDGNGVKGGVCRDLAGTFVSLMRAAGVPTRLVTGYLAGTVNGFHAWVEVYVGEYKGQRGWMPIDVSPLDGRWDEDFGIITKGPAVTMQAFGIRLPEYLPLRNLEADEEIAGWSTAIRAQFSYPSDQDPPELEFVKGTVDAFVDEQVMCVDSVTYARQFAATPSDCEIGDSYYGWDSAKGKATFVTAAVQIIDYGVDIEKAPPGSSIFLAVAYPYADELDPVQVEFEPYGPKGQSYRVEDKGEFSGYVTATLDY